MTEPSERTQLPVHIACEQALGGMKGERKEEGLYAHLKFYCSAPFLTFL